MKLTFNFKKGTTINGEVVYRAEGWADYTPDQIKQIIDGLAKGYEVRFNYDDNDPLIFKASQIESVTVHL